MGERVPSDNMKKMISILSVVILLYGCRFATKNEVNSSNLTSVQLISDYFSSLKIQRSIDNSRDTLIRFNNSVCLFVKRNCFQFPTGGLPPKVHIEFVMIDKPSKSILLNLNTQEKEGFLQTAGMFYLKASDSKGNLLNLKDGQSLLISSTFNNKFDFYKSVTENQTNYWQIIKNADRFKYNVLYTGDKEGVISGISPQFSTFQNINLSDTDCEYKLSNMGLEEKVIDSLLFLHALETQYIKSFSTIDSAFTNWYRTNSFGFFNCDAVLRMKKEKPFQTKLNLNIDKTDVCYIKYIFNKSRTIVDGRIDHNNGSVFMGNSDNGIIYLGKNEELHCVGILFKNDKFYYFVQKLNEVLVTTPVEFKEIAITEFEKALDGKLNFY